MKKKETVEIIVTYCDVCGEKCLMGHDTFVCEDGEHHACHGYDELHNISCREKLRQRLANAADEGREE